MQSSLESMMSDGMDPFIPDNLFTAQGESQRRKDAMIGHAVAAYYTRSSRTNTRQSERIGAK